MRYIINVRRNMDIKNAHTGQIQKDWSCFFYFTRNNLTPVQADILQSLDGLGSTDEVNLVAQFSLYDSYLKDKFPGETCRYYIEKKSSSKVPAPVIKEDLGQVDTGCPEILENFLLWSVKNFPAKHYMLVLNGHGEGFLGAMDDDITGNFISNKELAEILRNIYERTGTKIDILAFNSCLMSQTEVAYELKNSTKIMIGSEENENGSAVPLMPIIKRLQKETAGRKIMSPENMAKTYIDECKKYPQNLPTQSALNLSGIEALKNSVDELAGILIDKNIPQNIIQNTIENTKYYDREKPFSDYRDLYDFAEKLLKEPLITSIEVKNAARTVMDNINKLVISEYHDKEKSANSHGISIYMPIDFPISAPEKNEDTKIYEETSFARYTLWDEMLKKYSKSQCPL